MQQYIIATRRHFSSPEQEKRFMENTAEFLSVAGAAALTIARRLYGRAG
jgi:hypothetical protein